MGNFQFPIEYKRYVPASLIGGLERYFNEHIETGSFLRSVLENDLRFAVARADWNNKQALPDLVAALHHSAPEEAWGSKERVAAWLGEKPIEYSQGADTVALTFEEARTMIALLTIFSECLGVAEKKAETDSSQDACMNTLNAVFAQRELLKSKIGE